MVIILSYDTPAAAALKDILHWSVIGISVKSRVQYLCTVKPSNTSLRHVQGMMQSRGQTTIYWALFNDPTIRLSICYEAQWNEVLRCKCVYDKYVHQTIFIHGLPKSIDHSMPSSLVARRPQTSTKWDVMQRRRINTYIVLAIKVHNATKARRGTKTETIAA